MHRYSIPEVKDTQKSDSGSSPICTRSANHFVTNAFMSYRANAVVSARHMRTYHAADSLAPACQCESEKPNDRNRDAEDDKEVDDCASDPHQCAVGNLDAQGVTHIKE